MPAHARRDGLQLGHARRVRRNQSLDQGPRADTRAATLTTRFTSCDADAAYPPGVYPETNGSTSTFAQRYTGTYTDGAGSTGLFTVGETVTPQTPYSTPASSNCSDLPDHLQRCVPPILDSHSMFTDLLVLGMNIVATGSSNSSTSGSMMSMSGSMTMMSGSAMPTGMSASAAAAGAGSASGAGASGSAAASSAKTSGGAMARYNGVNYGPAVAGVISLLAVVAGAGALLL